MDLTSAFVDFAQLGANWVLWLLVVLSVVSVGIMIDRGLWFREILHRRRNYYFDVEYLLTGYAGPGNRNIGAPTIPIDPVTGQPQGFELGGEVLFQFHVAPPKIASASSAGGRANTRASSVGGGAGSGSAS